VQLNLALNLPEESFTATLQQGLEDQANTTLVAERSQIAVIDDAQLEVFLPFTTSVQETALTLVLQLAASDNAFDVTVADSKLGSLKLPVWIEQLVLQPAIQKQLPQLNASLGQHAAVEQISSQNGVLKINGTFDISVN